MPLTASRTAALLGAASLCIATLAGAREIVGIGGQEKRAMDTVRELANGDAACYLSLQEDRGSAFDAQVLPALAAAKAGAAPDAPASPGQASFCSGVEVPVFACRVGAKLVSVCASKDASRTGGYVQYRFGKPDSREPIELAVPAGLAPAAKAATGESVPFAGGGGAWMRFRHGAHAYVVYTGVGKWGPNGQTRTKEGLVVEKDGKRLAHFKCNAPAASGLGPDWFDRVGVQGKGEDFDFPD